MINASTDTELALERIDHMMSGCELCQYCAQPMTLNPRDGSLWFECTSLGARSGIQLRIAMHLHDRRLVEMPPSTVLAA
jgi:hypothetical protein